MHEEVDVHARPATLLCSPIAAPHCMWGCLHRRNSATALRSADLAPQRSPRLNGFRSPAI